MLQLLHARRDLAFLLIELFRVGEEMIEQAIYKIFKFIHHFGALGQEDVFCPGCNVLHHLDLLHVVQSRIGKHRNQWD